MVSQPASTSRGPTHELRFGSLFHEGRGYAFPCDARGSVDLAQLSERARSSYLEVCRAVGREVQTPVVRSTMQ